MTGPIATISKRLRPELSLKAERERLSGQADVLGTLYAAPLALAGLAWLVASTDLAQLRAHWAGFLLLFVLAEPFRRLEFFLVIEVRAASNSYSDYSDSLETMILWSGALLWGPTALWVAILRQVIGMVSERRAFAAPETRWNVLRNWSSQLAEMSIGALLGLAVYRLAGGASPLPGLAWAALWPAMVATLVRAAFSVALLAPIFAYVASYWRAMASDGGQLHSRLMPLGLVALASLVNVFALLAAGLWAQNGLGAYLFFIAAMLLAALLAHFTSRSAERNRQMSSQLEKLERLGRAIIAAPSDGSTYPALIAQHVPGMFYRADVTIRLNTGQVLVHAPEDAPAPPVELWAWLDRGGEALSLRPGETQPWDGQPAAGALAVAPIRDNDNSTPSGGICLVRQRRRLAAWLDRAPVDDVLPVLQTLAAQIASALQSADAYARALQHQKTVQELAVAGQIQGTFLPAAMPELPGWQVSAGLDPARETSGDFYDLIPLPGGRIGIVIADVADKGVGAALYMALSRTLIRTYAAAHAGHPAAALQAANRRILSDTRAEMFVTVFYGVLDPESGLLTYCNAGHNPPYHLRPDASAAPETLTRTGIPLGIFEDARWDERTLQLDPGDRLVLYTDGVTEAQNGEQDFYGTERLLEALQAQAGRPVPEQQDAVLADVRRFAGQAPQFDDITLIIVKRDQGGTECPGKP